MPLCRLLILRKELMAQNKNTIFFKISSTGHKMVTIYKILNQSHFSKDHLFWFYKGCCRKSHIIKGLTTPVDCKPFIYLVGGTGFEPVTSTV